MVVSHLVRTWQIRIENKEDKEEIKKSKLSSWEKIQCYCIVSPVCCTSQSSHGPVFSFTGPVKPPLSISWINNLKNEIMVVSGSPTNKGKGDVKTIWKYVIR